MDKFFSTDTTTTTKMVVKLSQLEVLIAMGEGSIHTGLQGEALVEAFLKEGFGKVSFCHEAGLAGDIVIMLDGRVLMSVERKSHPDFIGSFFNGHLWDQLRRMLSLRKSEEDDSQSPLPYLALLLTGTPADLRNPHTEHDVMLAALTNIQVEMGQNFALVQSPTEAAFPKRLATYAQSVLDHMEGKSHHAGCPLLAQAKVRYAKKKIDNPEAHSFVAIGIIDGMGDARARLLVDRFGSLEAIIAVARNNPDQLSTVTGVGPNLARRLCTVLINDTPAATAATVTQSAPKKKRAPATKRKAPATKVLITE